MTTVFSSWHRAVFLGALIAMTIFSSVTESRAMFYWDGNGSDPGAGATPNGTWGVDASWTEKADGTAPTKAWSPEVNAIFAAGNDATTYTVNVSGTQFVQDMHFDNGAVTLQNGTIAFIDGNRLISALPGVTGTINSVIASKNPGGVTTLTKYKMGTLILGGANTYSGSTKIEGGTLQLGAANRIPDGSSLVLANGGSDGFSDTPATFHTGGFNETLGTLKLTGPNASIARTLNFGNGTSALVFADSSAEDWEGIPLTIANYTPGVDSLRFGTSNSGLNGTQLASVVFADLSNVPATIDANGFVTPALPSITGVTGVGTSNTTISWTAISGRNYRVQYKASLNDPSWTDIVPDVFAVDTTASATDDTSNGNERYYRVLLLP